MKHTLLTLAILIGGCLNSNAQILNGGFENWNITTGFPSDWWGVSIPSYNLLTSTTSSHSGNFAVKLKVEDFNGQALSSPLSTGDGVTTCHTLTYVPGSVSFWYELDAIQGDELTLVALVYQAGVGVGAAVLAVPANQNYTYANAPVMYGTVPSSADSIAIIFTLTNTNGTAHIDTEAKIDDVSANVGSGIISYTALQNNLSVSPNPVNEKALIKFESDKVGATSIRIIDNSGKQVMILNDQKLESGKNEFEINTSGFKNGMYYCIITNQGNQAMKSFMVQH